MFRPLLRGAALGLAALAATTAGALADDLTIFAAASLKNAMDEISPAFEAATGHRVTVALAGSSALARQIQQGAPADVFISANSDWLDTLQTDGLIDPDTRRDLLANSLVLIAHGDAAQPVAIGPDLDLPALLGQGRLAMALVDAVPAGIYGKAALTSLGLWDAAAPLVAQTDNVRAALTLVSIGEAPLGIVYATDAVADPAVTVIGTFPEGSHPPIVYPAASVTAGNRAAAAQYLDWLQGDAARAAFERQGFVFMARRD